MLANLRYKRFIASFNSVNIFVYYQNDLQGIPFSSLPCLIFKDRDFRDSVQLFCEIK